MVKITQKFLFLAIVLCLAAGSAGAQEDLLWPVKPELMCKDWEVDDYTALRDVGDVSIWNTRDHLKIEIIPNTGYKFKEVNIHPVNDPTEFVSLLDKKGKPKISEFMYKTDYLEEYGILGATMLIRWTVSI